MLDLEETRKRRVPLWRRVLARFGNHKPENVWLERWQKRHDEKLKTATRRSLDAALAITVRKETRKVIASARPAQKARKGKA